MGKIIHLRQNYHFGPGKIAMHLARYHDITITKSGIWRIFWRRRGDLMAVTPLRWKHGPDDAAMTVTLNRTERAQAVKGWAEGPDQDLPIPIGGAMSGPMLVTTRLVADRPAAVEVRRAASVYGIDLPAFGEYRKWINPLMSTGVTAAIGLIVLALLRRRRRS